MLWDVAPIGPDEYRGFGDEGPNGRIFGGQVAAQALLSVGAPAFSMHARFVREGRGGEPVDYRVRSVGDDFRQVTATQAGRTILTLDVALGALAISPTVAVPAPAGWTPDGSDEAAWLDHLLGRMPFEFRFVGPPSPISGRRGDRVDGQAFWLRTRSRLADSAPDHQCALAYVSDLLLVSTALARHGLAHGSRPGLQSASLDHAVWFHAPFRADQWLLYEQETLTTGGGRGLCGGRISDHEGRLIATVRQEVLIRLR